MIHASTRATLTSRSAVTLQSPQGNPMPLGMRRAVLQAIAQAKLDDALLLFQHRRFSNAYYLAGYAVEIGLKACIAKQISAETIPDKAFINDIFKHGLRELIGVAGLSAELN